MRVIVTRPQREAQEWVRSLVASGLQAQTLPMIEIRPAPDLAPVQQAWRHLADYRALMFVSANAVDGFFAAKPDADASFTSRAWATGPGTVAALRRAGLAPQSIDAPPPQAAQFDSEALWQVVAGQLRPSDRVLIVRGVDEQAAHAFEGVGRDWLAQRIQQAGAQADFVVSYQRARPQLDAAQIRLALEAAGDGTVWLFSSSEAINHLRACLPQQDWSGARALATHARIAAAARQAGFGVVHESRPSLADVMASIESMG
jgi:uroporphyrinogen-III synthase